MRHLFFGSFLAASLVATFAHADGQVLRCDLKAPPGASFSATPLIIVLDSDAGVAIVYDPLIASIYEEPLPAKVGRKGDRITLNWTVANLPAQASRKAKVEYIASLTPETGRISVRGWPHGYDNTPTVVYGQCRAEKPGG
ncbi:hypothetical protein [Pseudogemmobacter humi]|uniref:Uncharacterized protein n=1 Tax=Pseudogemmobacter humi TaxID=2483812 RepID=A0A3P5XI39_9RHOB|nr:hypothetical protein [Pseudogemmobacter humi]VDC30564.1 hypothetical protein XINFAN_02590 [Pseudogemmobacter humi]